MYELATSAGSQTGFCMLASQLEAGSSHPALISCTTIDLPPEIWHRIFDFLFYIPGAFSTDAEAVESYSEDSEGITLHGLYDDVMSNKLAASMVCRAWRNATLPSLYSYVKIVNRRHAVLVANLFKSFKVSQGNEFHYGQLVKRFEVCAEDGFWDEESIDALNQCVTLMPNIQVYSDFFSLNISRSSDALVQQLQGLCEKGRLRRIEWSGTIARDVAQLLQGTPSLKVLITRDMPQLPLQLPVLESLVLRVGKAIQSSDMDDLQCPSLKSLIIHSHVIDTDTKCPTTKIPSSCPDVTRLRLLRSPGSDIIPLLEDLKSLRVLTLDLGLRKGDFTQLMRLKFKHECLSRLNIVHLPLVLSLIGTGGGGYASEERIIADFLDTLMNKDNLPVLKSIGIYIPRSIFSLVQNDERDDDDSESRNPILRKFWTTLSQLCTDRGIALEASVGSDAHFRGAWLPFRMNLVPRYLR